MSYSNIISAFNGTNRTGSAAAEGVDPPVANTDIATAIENGSDVTIDVTANDNFTGTKASLTVTLDDALTAGAVVVDGNNDVTYTPPATAQTDTFAYTITDSVDTSNSTTVTVTVQEASGDTFADLVTAAAPVMHWHRFAEVSGSTIVDASVNGRDGTYNGSPIFGAAQVVEQQSDGRAVDFSGGADGVLSFYASSAQESLSITGILRPSASDVTNGAWFVSQNSSGANDGNWAIRCDASGNGSLLVFYQTAAGGTRSISSPAGIVVGGEKLAFTFVTRSIGVEFWVNGELVGSDSGHTTGTIGNTDDILYMIDGPGGNRATGIVDEMIWHSDALDQTDIRALHEWTEPPPTPGGDAWNTVGGIDVDSLTADRIVNIANDTQFANAITDYQAGDHFVFANGTYTGRTIAINASETKPLVLRSSSAHGATITGTLTLNGSWIIVSRMRLRGSAINGNNNRITRSYITSGTIEFFSPASFGTIDYCEVNNFSGRGINFRPTQTNPCRDLWIHHNYVHDQTSTDRLAIGAAGGQRKAAANNALIERNLVENCGNKSFELKTSGCIVRFNTARNTAAYMNQRSGDGNQWLGNSCFNAGGISVSGESHVLAGNYSDVSGTGAFNSAGISLISGNTTSADIIDYINSGGALPAYARCVNIHIAGNEGGLVVAEDSNLTARPLGALNTLIEDHTGTVRLANESGTTNNSGSAATIDVPAYAIINTGDVGPLAT